MSNYSSCFDRWPASVKGPDCWRGGLIIDRSADPRHSVKVPLGFTLIEVLCVLAIVGILAAAALPSYSAHVRNSVMREGTLSLLGLALLEERLRLSAGRYRGSVVLLEQRPLPRRIEAYYRLRVELGPSAQSFKLVLEPRDPVSGYKLLSVDSRGQRLPRDVWP